jgi:hypothetical protein
MQKITQYNLGGYFSREDSEQEEIVNALEYFKRARN